LEAAAGALLAYHLGGRQTKDVLLGDTQAAWVEVETLRQELQERVLLQIGRGKQAVRAEISRRQRAGLHRQMQAAMGRYLAGWRRWLDRHAEQGGSPDRDGVQRGEQLAMRDRAGVGCPMRLRHVQQGHAWEPSVGQAAPFRDREARLGDGQWCDGCDGGKQASLPSHTCSPERRVGRLAEAPAASR
jgi:hypothetical protein